MTTTQPAARPAPRRGMRMTDHDLAATRMRAIVATGYGAADVLQLTEVEKPRPKANEILVRVRAATVSAGDIRMRSFTVPPMLWLPARLALGISKPRQPIYGMELAGDVEAVGKDVRRFKVGDQVFASTLEHKFGAHAEYKCLPEDGAVAAKPQQLSYAEAATLAIGAHTALHFLKAGKIQPGQKVLINGASGGVGTFAVQIARAMGARVTAVSSGRNADLVRGLGADEVLDYTQEDIISGEARYDVVFDAVNVLAFRRARRVLKPNGVFVTVNPFIGRLSPGWLARFRDGRCIESLLVRPDGGDLDRIGAWVSSGEVRPVIDRSYPLADAVEAHRYSESRRARGKLVLVVNEKLAAEKAESALHKANRPMG